MTIDRLEQRDFSRILLIKLSALGDVVHTFPLLVALRRRYPNAQIDWLSKPSPAELIRHHPDVSNVLVYGENHTEVPRYNWDGVTHFARLLGDSHFVGMLRGLRAAKYEMVIDVQGQLKSGFVSMVTGAPVRIGYERPQPDVWKLAGKKLPPGTIERAWKGAREGSWRAYTHHIHLDSLDIHAIDRMLKVGDIIGFSAPRPDLTLHVPVSADQRISALLSSRGVEHGQDPVVIAPATLWETKRWRAEGFGAVARGCCERGLPVVIVGSRKEFAECQAIADLAPGSINLAGETSVTELAALLKRAAVCVTNDSGPMHIAAAHKRPIVALFGPTNPAWIGPYGAPQSVITSGQECSPCYLRDSKRCTFDHACMRAIKPETVLESIDRALAKAIT